jgi:hypothetical protein
MSRSRLRRCEDGTSPFITQRLRDNGLDLVGAQSAATASSVQDQIGDLVRMRDQRQMTGLNLDRLGFHPIGPEALQLGRDRPVFRGDGVPTRLGPPGRLSRLPRK